MIFFWGAGNIGRKLLIFGTNCGMKVDYFIDNNPQLWETTIENVPIISVKKFIKISEDSEILITCKDVNSVFQQLVGLGIEKNKIVKCNSIICMMNYIFKRSELVMPIENFPVISNATVTANVCFDLSNGFVLGGVESWSVQTAETLQMQGYEISLITNTVQIKKCLYKKEENISTLFNESMTEWEKLEVLLSLMVISRYNNLICNFVNLNFAAACLAKKIFSDYVRLIVVIHNDEEIYYQAYSEMQFLIDKCLVISKMIKKKIIETGFPEEKIQYLPWKISCEESFSHIYTLQGECIHIGYAGRIVIVQKRLDYLILIAEQLKKRGICFLLEVAGTGSYEEELKQEIEKRNLSSFVQLLGRIERNEIKDFWKKQDIMISCSDWEGHSISQGEAMAAGAVPIITDVSGARDDVTDGENGFVVDIGAIDQIAEKICFLYYHRELLPVMGEKAYRTIKEKNSGTELERLWKEILLG